MEHFRAEHLMKAPEVKKRKRGGVSGGSKSKRRKIR